MSGENGIAGRALFLCFYAIPDAKPFHTSAGLALDSRSSDAAASLLIDPTNIPTFGLVSSWRLKGVPNSFGSTGVSVAL
jgi:hypothetical protein